MSVLRRFALLVLLIAALGGAGVYYYGLYGLEPPADQFRTVHVQRGDLLSTIGATGTLQPEEVVDVGAQVMGRILDLGIDFDAEKTDGPQASENMPPEDNAALAVSHVKSSLESRRDEAVKKLGQAPSRPLIFQGFRRFRSEPVPFFHSRDGADRKTPRSPDAGRADEPASDKRPRIDYGSIVHVGTELAYIAGRTESSSAHASTDRSRLHRHQITCGGSATPAMLVGRRYGPSRSSTGISWQPRHNRPPPAAASHVAHGARGAVAKQDP